MARTKLSEPFLLREANRSRRLSVDTLICAALNTQLFAIKSTSRIQTRFGLGKGGWEFPSKISSGSLKRSVTRFQRLPKKSNLKERLQTRVRRIAKRPSSDDARKRSGRTSSEATRSIEQTQLILGRLGRAVKLTDGESKGPGGPSRNRCEV
jgi:hypothetical protein